MTSCAQTESKLQLLCGFLPARSLDKLYNFADCAGLHLILGLNALHRNPDHSWNTSSTLSLLKYSAGKKYNISWELGNGQYNIATHAVDTHTEHFSTFSCWYVWILHTYIMYVILPGFYPVGHYAYCTLYSLF